VVSLHQVDLAKTYADRIIGLANGRVVFDGLANQISDDAYHRIYHGGQNPQDMPAGVLN